jgi:hypothetical protein
VGFTLWQVAPKPKDAQAIPNTLVTKRRAALTGEPVAGRLDMKWATGLTVVRMTDPRISEMSARAEQATEAAPIACTLDPDAMALRMAEFAQLFRVALVGRETTGEGIRFRFANTPGVEAQIRDLARREQRCCSFFGFAIEVHGNEVWWDATVTDRDARPVLDDLYALPERLGAQEVTRAGST